jgi:HEAT repeat protein
VRWEGAGALGKIGGETAVNALARALGDADGGVRAKAAEALGEIGGEKAVDTLILALRDIDANVRVTAAGSLGGLRAHTATDALHVLMVTDDNASVRSAAATALLRIRGAEIDVLDSLPGPE